MHVAFGFLFLKKETHFTLVSSGCGVASSKAGGSRRADEGGSSSFGEKRSHHDQSFVLFGLNAGGVGLRKPWPCPSLNRDVHVTISIII